jgi:K+-transporting ATPase c subunit
MGTASLRASLEQRLANKVANKAVAENVTRSVQQSPSNLAGNQWKDNSFLVPAPDWRRNTTRMITQPNQKENKSVTFDTTSQQLSYQIKPEDNVLMQAPPPDDTQLSAKRSTRYERGLGKAQTLFMNT